MTYSEMLEKIEEAKELYYQNGRSPMSDEEYDRLVKKASKLGYLETVGSKPVDSIPTITHEHPMLSLEKVHTVDEVLEFCKNRPVVAMDKADGLTCSLTYEDGILTRLETRGDGQVGNDVLFHANSFLNLPKTINKTGKYVIDGECVILQSDFEAINEKLAESEKYSNPRNLAAGSLNQLDPKISKTRRLRFYAWDIIEGGEGHTLAGNLLEAAELGFDTVNYWIIDSVNNRGMIETVLTDIRNSAKRRGFPIDGVVFKYNNIEYGKQLGATNHHFRCAKAYKFEDETYPTKLIDVQWQVGKTSRLTPLAFFEPVEIDNSIVEKASLHNITVMNQLSLTKGCTVYVKKANSIIPQIASADNDGDEEIEIPSKCPICGSNTKIVKANDSEVLYCSNPDCAGILLGKFSTFVSKKGMDIVGLSDETLKLFITLGWIKKFIDIYQLYENLGGALKRLDGFGEKSAKKLFAAIEASKDVDFVHFLTSLSIPGIGTGQSKMILTKIKTFREFQKACDDNYSFTQIDGIGEILDGNIHKWWSENRDEAIALANIMRFQEGEFMNPPVGLLPFDGITFVITGKVNHFTNRDEVKKKIESLGGKVADSVSKNTSYLINNDVTSTSGKNKKAKELGIPIITEEKFLQMCE